MDASVVTAEHRMVTPGVVPGGSANPGELGRALAGAANRGGPPFPWTLDEVGHRRIVERRTVAGWDVWLLAKT